MAALNAAAPRITDRLCGACAEHFAAVRAHLDALGVAVPAGTRPRSRARLLHPDRVRVLHRGREGQQQALGGGGRYDGLVELLGGRPTPGIGFGIGLDRWSSRSPRPASPHLRKSPRSPSSSAPTR